MELLDVDYRMDLVSSPAKAPEDFDFDLGDVREVSVEPSQDLMLQDEADHLGGLSNPVISATSDHADDDLMLDEDATIQQEDQTELIDLNMDNNQDGLAEVEGSDDILYEDEEDPRELEEKMDDGDDMENQRVSKKAETSNPVRDEWQEVGGDIDLEVATAPDVGEEINIPSEHLQTTLAGTIEDVSNNGYFTAENLDSNPEQNLGSALYENDVGNHFDDQGTEQEHEPAEVELNQKHSMEPDVGDIGISVTKSDHGKANSDQPIFEVFELDSHPRPPTNSNSPGEEAVRESAPETRSLHTVKIHYLGTEMCLFPPEEDDETEMFFLQDVSLAYESLDKMLGACRDVLANAIGQDDELVLDIASLGLHISEVSCLMLPFSKNT